MKRIFLSAPFSSSPPPVPCCVIITHLINILCFPSFFAEEICDIDVFPIVFSVPAAVSRFPTLPWIYWTTIPISDLTTYYGSPFELTFYGKTCFSYKFEFLLLDVNCRVHFWCCTTFRCSEYMVYWLGTLEKKSSEYICTLNTFISITHHYLLVDFHWSNCANFAVFITHEELWDQPKDAEHGRDLIQGILQVVKTSESFRGRPWHVAPAGSGR